LSVSSVGPRGNPQLTQTVGRLSYYQIFKRVQQMNDLEKQSIAQFNAWSKDYDQKRFLPFYFSNKAVLNSLNPRLGSSILDVGCGTGILLHKLLQLGKDLNLYGMDIAPEMVRVARAKFGELVEIREGSANSLPYDDNSLDYVTCATSFHHYPDPDNSLREMFRVLKSGGKLIILDPFTNGLLRKTICAILDIIFNEKGTNLFTKEKMCQMFQRTGFNQIEQKTYLYYKLITVGVKTFDGYHSNEKSFSAQERA
jgi:ubiquinone/menaquinone biosynthesis C-methylase UbiE